MGERKVTQCRVTAIVSAAMAVFGPLVLCWLYSPTWAIKLTSVILSTVCVLVSALAWDISGRCPADSHTATSLLLQYLLINIFVRVGAKVYHSFHTNSLSVQEQQDKVLMTILARNQQCQYFRDKKLDGVGSVEEFLSTQPLTQYQHYSSYIDNIEAGKANILTKDPVVFMALTSGTTGKNKHIPITPDMKGPAAHKVGPLMYYCMQLKSGLSLRRVMVLSYKSHVSQTPGGLDVGPVSAHMSRYVPFVVAPRESYDITEEQAALHVHAVFGFLESEVGHMEALMSTLVYSFWKYVEYNWQVICDDIERGEMNENLSMDRLLLQQLSTYLTPNPERATQLRAYFQQGFNGVAKKIWPEMKFVRTLTTGGFAHHAQIVTSLYMQGIKMLSLAHVASEGFMGFNINKDPDVQLYTSIVNYGFLEFIPVDDVDLDQPTTHRLHQLKLSEEYEVVITSPMGLYRYRTGDVIKVVDFLNQSPVYCFQYRMGQLLNLYWEKTHESALYLAVMQAVERLRAEGKKIRLVDYTATEDVCMPGGYSDLVERADNKKHYVLFLELEGDDGKELILDYRDQLMFDRCLGEISELYAMIRESGSAGCIGVLQLKPGAFLQLKAHLIDQTQNQQYKVPRVMRRQEYLRILMLHRYGKLA